jgi:hypothetical protein
VQDLHSIIPKYDGVQNLHSVPSEANGYAKQPWHMPLPQWIRTFGHEKGSRVRPLKPYQTAILQLIADRCDKNPIDEFGSLAGCFIGYDSLATKTGMCRRTAINHINGLMAMGLLVKKERGGINFRTGECLANAYAIPGRYGALDRTVKGHDIGLKTLPVPQGKGQRSVIPP